MRQSLTYAAIAAAVLIGTVVLRVLDPEPVARLRLVAFDTYQRLAPRAYDPQSPVRILDIDEASLERLGQWPWPRSRMAEITTRLQEAGAAAIGFDLLFPEPDRLSPESLIASWPALAQSPALKAELEKLPGTDAAFAKALETTPAVLGFVGGVRASAPPPQKAGFAFAGDDPLLFVPRFEAAARNLPLFDDGARGLGSLNWIPEADQVVRRVPLLVAVGETLYPGFAAETLRTAFGAATLVVKSSGASGVEAFGEQTGVSELRIGEVTVPTGADGQMWLYFSRSDPSRYLPAWKLLDGSLDPSEVSGRIVLVGASAAGLLDLRTTPIERAVPGVEVHAQAIEQMIEGTHLYRPDYITAAELLYALVVGAGVAVLIYAAGAAWGAGLGLLSLLGVGAASWLAFTRLHWLLDPVYPSLAVTVLYIAGTAYLYLRTETERRRVRSAFSHYMAPAMVAKLAADPGQLKLGGETREISVLFADVRGFTGISEGLDAEALIRFVNRLFTPLSGAILAKGGTIDKYMGDAVMAFWNAPLADPDHARNACRAALAMLAALEALNRELGAEAARAGTEHRPVRLGIGINTGRCCVGNLGSEQRFDYSAIGDDVNVASRLEGLCKAYQVPVVIGEATAAAAGDLAILELETTAVRGKQARMRVFALLGDENMRRSQAFAALAAAHAHLLTALAGPAGEAEAALEALRPLASPELTGLYDVYAARLAAARHAAPERTTDEDRDA